MKIWLKKFSVNLYRIQRPGTEVSHAFYAGAIKQNDSQEELTNINFLLKGSILDITFKIADDTLHIPYVFGYERISLYCNYERTFRQSQRVRSKFI